MSTLLNAPQSLCPQVRVLPDSRPAGHTLAIDPAPQPDQPALAFGPAAVGPRPQPSGHRVHVLSSPWTAAVSPGLSDAPSWSASLALAVAEAL